MPTLKPFDSARTEECVTLIRSAFREDPLFSAVSKGKQRNYELLLELFARVWLTTQTVFTAEENGAVIGVAILGDEASAAVSVGRLWKSGAGKVLMTCGIGSVLGFLNASGQFDRAFQNLEGPRHYLTLLAVSPDAQGKGTGSALLQSRVLPYVRGRGGRTLCLNTNKERNRNFYRKNGFTEIASDSCRINGQQVENWSFILDVL